MKTIYLSREESNGKAVLKLVHAYDAEIWNLLRNTKRFQWDMSRKVWTTSYSEECVKLVSELFENKANVNLDSLYSHNENTPRFDVKLVKLDEQKLKEVEAFIKYMKSKRYSDRTTEVYKDALITFLKFHHSKSSEEITNEDVIRFNNEYILKNDLSSSYQNQVVNAIKLFYMEMKSRKMNIELIHRPKREKLLPNVLSKEDVQRILTASANMKHRTMLSVIYACGLRRSELLNMKPTDVNSERKLLTIKQAKGRKDRVVMLSDKIIEMLREYYKYYRPKVWMFEGQTPGTQYSEKSLEQVMKQAVAKAGIKRPATLHWLRHSFATHLHESGSDIRTIQELLGHSSSKTTEIYTHVSNRAIQNIRSPFDDLNI